MDARERLEKVEDDLYNLGEAADYLCKVQDMDEIVDCVKDRMIVLGFERNELRRRVNDEDERETRALEREYYSGL